MRLLLLAALLVALPALASAPDGELPVDPYEITAANAGAAPLASDALYEALGAEAGITRIIAGLVDGLTSDPRTADIFRASDLVRLRRTLVEQVCFLAGGPCTYTGRDMVSVHKDQGITTREFNALVENLQVAMDAEGIAPRDQNKLLALLAPMHRDVVTR